jgi:hypothetical protein
MVASGIRFNDCFFTESTCLPAWRRPRHAGLFVILAHDANWAPKPYQPLYFGEFGNNSEGGVLPEAYSWMLDIAGGTSPYVAVLPMPFSTTRERLALSNELLWAYNPPSQAKGARDAAAELARRLDDVETKPREEQTAQMLLLLAGANRMFGPQPEPERRRIGFLP